MFLFPLNLNPPAVARAVCNQRGLSITLTYLTYVKAQYFFNQYCKKSGLFTVHFFYSVQIGSVSKNHGFKSVAVLVSSLSRLTMDGSREPRFGAVRFTVPGKVCGLVAVRYALNNSSLPERWQPPCSQLHRYVFTASYPLFYISIYLHRPSPQQPPLVPIAHPERIGCVFPVAPR